MILWIRDLTESKWFQNFIIGVILLTAVLVGIETYPAMIERYGETLHLLDKIILTIFTIEILLKMVGRWPRPDRFFRDPWNLFDFVIVAAAFLPLGQYVTVLRLLRLLRVLRLVRALPQLRILVSALLKSLPSMFYVGIFLFMLFYIYAVASVFLFGQNDPIHFETLPLALLSLFRIVTLEDWTDIMYINMYGCDHYGYDGFEQFCTNPSAMPIFAALFFSSFVLIGTMIVLNLFIGVIMNGMDDAKKEIEAEKMLSGTTPTPEEEWVRLERDMHEIEQRMASIRKAMARRARTPFNDSGSDDGGGKG